MWFTILGVLFIATASCTIGNQQQTATISSPTKTEAYSRLEKNKELETDEVAIDKKGIETEEVITDKMDVEIVYNIV